MGFRFTFRVFAWSETSLTTTNRPSVIATTTTISQNRTSPVVAIRVAAFRRIHRSRSCSVDAVRTVFENRVFMMPMSKKIFEMTGMDVIATPMVKTSAKETSFPMVPMYASRKTRMNG